MQKVFKNGRETKTFLFWLGTFPLFSVVKNAFLFKCFYAATVRFGLAGVLAEHELVCPSLKPLPRPQPCCRVVTRDSQLFINNDIEGRREGNRDHSRQSRLGVCLSYVPLMADRWSILFSGFIWKFMMSSE